MSEEKKWKCGDIGPDGRVFWRYSKKCPNGEWWVNTDRFQQLLEKEKERVCRYNQENREKEIERRRCYRQENREKVAEAARRFRQENREKIAEALRRKGLKKTLQKSQPKTLSEFYALLVKPHKTLAAIFTLNPDEGQTLAELIHKLSGYPMNLCEQIANPSEPEPEPTPEPQPALKILPDLF